MYKRQDYNTAFTELQAGALDALAIDIGVAKYQLNSRGEGFKMLDETLNTEEYAIGFKKGNQAPVSYTHLVKAAFFLFTVTISIDRSQYEVIV